MSHNIHYITCRENADRKSIMADIQVHAKMDGDGYSSKMTWHDKVEPFDTQDEAYEFIKKHDNGWYDDHAVRYRDYSGAVETAKIKEYFGKIKELMADEKKYRDEHSVHTFKAKHIGCLKCGSKLNKDYIVGECCPLCRADLRGKTTLEKLEWYKNKKADYYERIEAEKKKQKSKAKVMWLVKYEYHS